MANDPRNQDPNPQDQNRASGQGGQMGDESKRNQQAQENTRQKQTGENQSRQGQQGGGSRSGQQSQEGGRSGQQGGGEKDQQGKRTSQTDSDDDMKVEGSVDK